MSRLLRPPYAEGCRQSGRVQDLSFKQIGGLDRFHVLLQGRNVRFLIVMCHGTHFGMLYMMDGGPLRTSRCLKSLCYAMGKPVWPTRGHHNRRWA